MAQCPEMAAASLADLAAGSVILLSYWTFDASSCIPASEIRPGHWQFFRRFNLHRASSLAK